MTGQSRIISRIHTSALERSVSSQLITALIGPRQSGKTTSINSLVRDVPINRKLYINLDSSFERDRIRNNEHYLLNRIEEIMEGKLASITERFYLIVDEAQKFAPVFESIKILYDQYADNLKIILSGSSSLELLDRTSETLAGRVHILRIYPFSMSEASLYENIDDLASGKAVYQNIFSGSLNKDILAGLINEFRPKCGKKAALIETLLTRSLFPPTFSRIDQESIPRWLSDYIDTYIEKDMRSVADIGNIEGYRRVVAQLASRAGSLLDYSHIGRDAAVNQLTAKKYVSIWQESLIGFLLSPFFLNLSTRIKKSKKVYFFDNALIWALSGFKEKRIIEASGETGHYFENLIITDFMKWGANLDIQPSFFFWEKSEASEVDLVISSKGMTIPVEINYSTTWDKRHLHAIDMFREKHSEKGLSIPFSLIIYRGDFFVPREDVFCIPAWILC
ncbi:MAG: ATP-binding protein [Nitrospirae bacterium]|nr:ATP-binding protein [Nitrospirota bacterium]